MIRGCELYWYDLITRKESCDFLTHMINEGMGCIDGRVDDSWVVYYFANPGGPVTCPNPLPL